MGLSSSPERDGAVSAGGFTGDPSNLVSMAKAEQTTGGSRSYQVKLVRGPFVRLQPHADHCATGEEFIALCASIKAEHPNQLLAADLFSGAGGLSLGLEQAGMRVVLSADHDAEAVETHRHHFAGLAVDWDLGDPNVVERVASLMNAGNVDVLAGGPPCQPFSKAGRSGIRYRVRQGLRDPHDRRRDLWRSFVEVARLAEPRVVIMENVPDMALDREMFILRSIVLELEELGYSVEERVVDAWKYGVPQFRQRLILVAIKDGYHFEWPAEQRVKVTVNNAIGDLPRVDGGWRPDGGADGWAEYDQEPRSSFQRAMRAGVATEDASKVFDHITRPVREDDLEAFELLDTKMRYSDLPPGLKRYRDDIFDDKYKRLDADNLSRTITAHIAKDGYWYIHPEQNRTLTVREAARLQTFPDYFRFAGPPSAAFRQIGNAVPPLLGEAIGRGVVEALAGEPATPMASEESGRLLAEWFTQRAGSEVVPWLVGSTRWQALAGEILLDRASTHTTRSIWPLVARWATAAEALAAADELMLIGSWAGKDSRAADLVTIAARVAELQETELSDDVLSTLVKEKLISETIADLVRLASTDGQEDVAEEPVLVAKGVLRVAARVNNDAVDQRNRLTDGRVAIARLVGYGRQSRVAHLALIELANTLCAPGRPDCAACPLRSRCLFAASLETA
jgi:DNA (cytosine-5)-methyltransferase 1